MRLTTQIVLGHLGLVLTLVALGALGVALLDRMARNEALVLREAREALARLNPAGGGGVSAGVPAERARALLEGIQRATEAAESSERMGKSGAGLIGVVAALGLVVTLYFGFWLSKVVTQPIERLARGIDHAVAGDLSRRFGSQGTSGVVSDIAAGLDTLLDRLQRAESAPRTDLLLACAAVERLCDADAQAAGVLAAGHRLIASNEAARALVLQRGSSLQWLAGEAERRSPGSVETVDLKGPSGEVLGQLVRFPVTAIPPAPSKELV